MIMPRRYNSATDGPVMRKPATDLESQTTSNKQHGPTDFRPEHLVYLGLVFGNLDLIQQKYRGILAYCHYIEGSFDPLLTDNYMSTWAALELERPASTVGCWSLPIAVFNWLQHPKLQPQDVSIDTILNSLLKDSSSSPRTPAGSSPRLQEGNNSRLGQHHPHAYSQIAVFAVFCWATMTLTPNLQPPDTPALACLAAGRSELDPAMQQKLGRCSRPIAKTFHGFKEHAWGKEIMKGLQSVVDGNEDIYQASFNMRSLQLFGKVRIQWVTTITAHLEFDPASRRLSLFKFPSLCALKCLESDSKADPILKSISEEFDPLPSDDSIHRYITLEQEILLSYRLLFAQSGASRRVAQKELAKLRRENPATFDPFLSVLCERKYRIGILWWSKVDKELADLPSTAWPLPCLDVDGLLQERDVYSAIEDFPRLGQRLLRVQKFNARWRPSRLTDFWRDRRNPYQWYTFWAVLIFGGVANLLAVMQLAVAVYQAIPLTTADAG